MEEKEYTFTSYANGVNDPVITKVKESQLTKPQMDLLYANLIRMWGEMPVFVKTKFLYMLQAALPENTERAAFLKKAIDEEMEKMVGHNPLLKVFEVWSEGYVATGEHGTAQFHGKAMAENFTQACEAILGDRLDRNTDGTLRVDSQGRPCIWACVCFDNETDARKNYG